MAQPDEPAGLPSGNAKYVVAAIVLLLGIGGIAMFRFFNSDQPVVVLPPPPAPTKSAAAPLPSTSDTVADVAAPVDAGVDAPAKVLGTVAASGPVQSCASPCTGMSGSDLSNSLSARAQQARGCYNQALLTDSTLKGNVNVSVRIGPTGATCGPASVSTQMGGVMSSCVQRVFSGSYPAPHGGCVDATVPLSFSTR